MSHKHAVSSCTFKHWVQCCSQDVPVLTTDVIGVCCVQTNRHGGIPRARGSNLMKTAARHQGHAAYLHPAYSAEVPLEAAAHLQEAALLWLAKYTNHPPQSHSQISLQLVQLSSVHL